MKLLIFDLVHLLEDYIVLHALLINYGNKKIFITAEELIKIAINVMQAKQQKTGKLKSIQKHGYKELNSLDDFLSVAFTLQQKEQKK